jgi:fructoselysine-6-P-deglycase FrlB-like protein
MISEIEAEVSGQPASLAAFLAEGTPAAPSGSLLVGAGDSYAACCIASRQSGLRHFSLDPYELISAPGLARGRTVCFVSVSGMTASNVTAAKAVRGVAEETLAVTANPRGRILKEVDAALFLPHRSVPRLPGTLSFSLSLLALLKLTQEKLNCDFSSAFSRAKGDAGRVLYSRRGVTHFLGNGPILPVCLYSALKAYEVLGAEAQCSLMEEFSHANLFSLKESDAVNLLCSHDPLSLGRRLAKALRTNGFRVAAFGPFGQNEYDQIFYSVFLSQLAIVREARRRKLQRPYFIGAKKRLAVSDSMIY